jgi:threonine dehydratase
MWELVQPLLDGSIVVSLREIVSAIGLLFERNRVIAEGAGRRLLLRHLRVRLERVV